MTVQERDEDLERRMSELEAQAGLPIPSLRQVHTDLLNFHEQVTDFREEMTGFREDTGRRFDKVDTDISGLRADMPGIVAASLREVLGDHS